MQFCLYELHSMMPGKLIELGPIIWNGFPLTTVRFDDPEGSPPFLSGHEGIAGAGLSLGDRDGMNRSPLTGFFVRGSSPCSAHQGKAVPFVKIDRVIGRCHPGITNTDISKISERIKTGGTTLRGIEPVEDVNDLNGGRSVPSTFAEVHWVQRAIVQL